MAKQVPPERQGKQPFHPERRHTKPKLFKPGALRWALIITGWSFIITFLLSMGANRAMDVMGLVSSMIVLVLFILLGIAFDILGLATATVSEKPFHSMSARRVRGAREALRLISNANQVSSFCNDVVGDISGIISGTTCTVIAGILINDFEMNSFLTALLLSSICACLTVGGKALGKSYAMAKNVKIVHFMGKVISVFHRRQKP